MSHTHILDQSALKFNQLSIVALTTAGFIFNQPLLPAFTAAVMIGGSLVSTLALFKMIYLHVVKPLHLMTPNPIQDSPAPHEFAQLLGGCVLGIGSLFLFFGSVPTGWVLAWVVIFLALANLLFGFCAGCFVYYHLGKLGVPGFLPQEQKRTVAR
jgi:hypothetical protein